MSERRAFAALAPVYLSVFLFVAGSSGLSLLVPVYLSRSAGLGEATIGAVAGVYGIASLAARLPTGILYTIARGRALLLCGGALSAVAFALVPAVHGAAAFSALMALNGLGWSIASTAQLALLVARPPGGVSTATAMGWFSGATGLGNAAAVLGGAWADLVGLRATFLAFAVTPLAAALLMTAAVGKRAGAPEPATRAQPRERPWRMLGSMPLAVWAGTLVMFFINALNAITNTFHPLIAVRAGLSLTEIGALSSIRSWASSSSRFGSGPLFARVNPVGLTLPLVVAGTASTAAIPSVIGSFALQVPLFAVAGLSRGLLRVTGSADAFVAVEDDERRHGLTAALLYGGLDVGRIAGPVLGGIVAGALGIATMLRVLPLGLLALYLALALGARRASERRAARLSGEPRQAR